MKAEDHIDRMLDAALEMTFPASDPIAVYIGAADPEPGLRAQKYPVQAAPING